MTTKNPNVFPYRALAKEKTQLVLKVPDPAPKKQPGDNAIDTPLSRIFEKNKGVSVKFFLIKDFLSKRSAEKKRGYL